MEIIFFKFGLPILLGYTFFVGISGRYIPFLRPKEPAQRPSWFLGAWTGLVVASTLIYGLHLAYQMDISNLSSLLVPGALLFGAAMLPGIIGYAFYRRSVSRQINAEAAKIQTDQLLNQPENQQEVVGEQISEHDFSLDDTIAHDKQSNIEMDATVKIAPFNVEAKDEQTVAWSDLDIASAPTANAPMNEEDELKLFDIDTVKYETPLLINDATNKDIESEISADAEAEPATELSTETTDEVSFEAEPTTELSAETTDEVSFEAEPATELSAETTDEISFEAEPATELSAETTDEISFEAEPATELSAETTEEASFEAELDAVVANATSIEAANASAEAHARDTAQNVASKLEIERLNALLSDERNARKDLETHLRVTRKGLAELDSESREFESQKAQALTELEQELEDKVKRMAAADARADREAAKRESLEIEIVNLRQDTLKATKLSRESVEARARALSTANKATTFARQAVEARARLETQLEETDSELEMKRETISSLIRSLEKEKARTQEQVNSKAKELILHEKQLQARRTLEEASRSVDSKLGSRLVKKIAKARG